jgi:polysaccharide deacetylase family protein (PEP-CTERM system associated)
MAMSGAPPVTFTLDLEDHRPSDSAFPARYADRTLEVLDLLDREGVAGTVFVVGEVAEASPELVAEVAGRGHEVGLHAWRHVPLTDVEPARFIEETQRGKALLEDITGRPVVGFRAPTFSLVPETRWATDVLTDLGFTYSSSVLPARNPLFGDPTAPATPFRWSSGLVELPCPVWGVGPAKVPFLGGVYLRALPRAVVAFARSRLPDSSVPWIYCHPYDLDPDEPRWVVPDAGRVGSRLLWANRGATRDRIAWLLRDGAGGPLAGRAGEVPDDQTATVGA